MAIIVGYTQLLGTPMVLVEANHLEKVTVHFHSIQGGDCFFVGVFSISLKL